MTDDLGGGLPEVLIVADHPVQHFAPLYRSLNDSGAVRPRVLYLSAAGADSYFDAEFGRAVQWDVPLLDGYQYEIYRGRTPRNRTNWRRMRKTIAPGRPAIIVVHGYAGIHLWKAA